MKRNSKSKPRAKPGQTIRIVQGYSVQHPPKVQGSNSAGKPTVDIRSMEQMVLPWDFDLSARS